jgi:hypothetical protein
MMCNVKMKAARSSKILSCHNIAWCYNPEDLDLNLHHSGNPKWHFMNCKF